MLQRTETTEEAENGKKSFKARRRPYKFGVEKNLHRMGRGIKDGGRTGVLKGNGGKRRGGWVIIVGPKE